MAETVALDTAVKIVNVAYPNNAADLIWGNPLGTVSGYQLNDSSKNQEWVFRKGEPAGVAIESVAAPGYYASSHVQAKGAPITGSPQNTGWYLRPVPSPDNVYWIESVDGQYVWSLDDGANFFTILLQPAKPDPGPKSHWSFPSVPK